MKKFTFIFILFCMLGWQGEAPLADDTEIYGASAPSARPNVLIIFDNNSTMGDLAATGDPYDPNTVVTWDEMATEHNAGTGDS